MQTFKQFLESSDMHEFIREKWLHAFLWDGHVKQNSATTSADNARWAFKHCASRMNQFMHMNDDPPMEVWVMRWALIALGRPFDDPKSLDSQTFIFNELRTRMKEDGVWEE